MKKQVRKVRKPTIRKSSGNVFADLRLPEPEDALAKAKMASQICQVIAQRRLTQTEAGKILGLDQPKISALVRGKLSGFSVDRLFRFLNDLGQEVEITIRPARLAGRRGGTHVVAAAN